MKSKSYLSLFALLCFALSIPSTSFAVGCFFKTVAKNSEGSQNFSAGRKDWAVKAKRISHWKRRQTAAVSNYQPWTSPGISVSTPAAYGASWGHLFAGGSVTSKSRTDGDADGAFGFGMGFLDPDQYVGLETAVSVTDVSGFERGGVSFKVHRNLPMGFAIAAGRELALTWGGSNDQSRSWYGALSKVFFLGNAEEPFNTVTLSAGLGDGRFRPESKNLAREQVWNLFASAAVRVLEPVSFITDWTGQAFNVGLSVTPLRTTALFINPAIIDIGGVRGGAKFTVSAGIAYDFNS